MKILRPKPTSIKCGFSTRHLHRLETDPDYEHYEFPKSVDIGPNSKGFIEQEVDDWLEKRAALRATEP